MTPTRTPGRPTLAESRDIQQRILYAATDDFMNHGYAGSNLARIARLAGSTKPTVYRLFVSKESLFRTVVAHALHAAAARIRYFADDSRSPKIVLTMVAGHMLRSYSGGILPGLWRAVESAARDFPELHAQTRDLWRQDSIARKLADYFAALDRRGVLRIADPALAAYHFALLVGPGSAILDSGTAADAADERIQEVIGLFLRGYDPRAFSD